MSEKYLSIFIFCECLLTVSFSLDSSSCVSADAELGSFQTFQNYLEEVEMRSLQGSLRGGRPCRIIEEGPQAAGTNVFTISVTRTFPVSAGTD